MPQENPLQLNDFITYDCDKEKFIVQEYTINIPAMEFSFDDIVGISPENKTKYKNLMKDILYESVGKFPSTYARRGNSVNKNGNGKGRDYKKTIESSLMKHLLVTNHFNIFLTGNSSISLKGMKVKK